MTPYEKQCWIELLYEISEVSPSAADWLADDTNTKNLKSFDFPMSTYIGVAFGTLSSSFIWEESPQGHLFWQEIAEKMARLGKRQRRDYK